MTKVLRQSSNRRRLLISAPMILLLALIGWRLLLKTRDASEQTQMMQARKNMVPVVRVAPATVRDIVQHYEGVGTVESKLNVNIAAKVAGRIEVLQVREGDHVKPGQILVRIDPTEVEAEVRQKDAALAEAQYRLAQAKISQNPTNVNVTTQIRQQQAGVLSASADYNQVSRNFGAQLAAAESLVTEAQGNVNSAQAAISSADAAISSAKANLDNATFHLKRVTDLYKQGFIAAQDVDDAKTEVSVKQGALDVAKQQRVSAVAQRDAAMAQKNSREKQVQIVRNKGQADIEAANARVAQSKASLDYAKANTAQTPAFVQNIAALQASVNAAKADAAAARSKRADTILRAPLDGYVTARQLDPGAIAGVGQPILTVQSVNTLWISVPIPEEASASVYIGLSASVVIDALPGKKFAGKVVQINPSADPESRQFTVRIAVENPHSQIKPGMFARVMLVTQRIHHAIVIPREGVQSTPKGSVVLAVNSLGVVRRTPVLTGAQDSAGIAIISGIQTGDKVVVMSSQPIKDGQTVRFGSAKSDGKAKTPGSGADQ